MITKKQSDFLLFKSIIEIISKGQHLTDSGLFKIASLKASLNKGLPEKLNKYFPTIIKVERPKVNIPININPHWIGGFYSGVGCFYVNIYKSKEHKIGYGIALQIILGQHNRDRLLLEKIVNILESGKIYERKNSNTIV